MNSPAPRVSILMLTYNRPQMIGRAIASVREQTFTGWELIVVQDGQNPATEKLVAEWLAADSRIQFFPRGVVGSIAEASNFGLAKARGEYVAILDDDDWWAASDKLERQVEFLDRSPDYAGVGGGFIVVDEGGRRRGVFVKPETDAQIRRSALIANPIANSTAMFRRTMSATPALYDTGMRQFADWDFWLSAGARGKLHNFPDTLAYYALWPGGSSYKNLQGNARAALQIIRRHRYQYPGYPRALAGALLYSGYAHLPEWFRKMTYESLSAFKKTLMGGSLTIGS